jgi:HEAT repeat protein
MATRSKVMLLGAGAAVVIAVVIAALVLGDKGAALARQTRDADTTAAARAIHSLALRDDREEYRSDILAAASDARPQVRAAAIAAMELYGETADTSLIRKALAGDGDPRVRAAAAKCLGGLRFWDAMEDLLDAMYDKSADVRGQAGAAVKRMLGRDYYFRASAPPGDRQRIIERIRREYPGFHQAHLDYLKRLKEREP